MESPDQARMHEPRHAVAMMGTLMPHLAHERHYIYRNAAAGALLAALIAAAFGSLSIALVLAAVALPAVVLTYIHDHNLWRDEPLTVIAATFALSLGLGVGVGFLQTHFTPGVAVAIGHYRMPPVSRILELGVLVPVVAFVAALFAPLLVTSRAAFRHPMDVVVTCALSGAAVSLGWSLVVQHGAFTHLQATAGDPAHVAFIALTLGFLQPVIVATAAAVAALGLRSDGVNPALAVAEGVLLLVLYGLATTLLASYGARGIVLTTFAAFVLAGAGLVATRTALHAAVDNAPDVGRVEHRLHGAVVAAIIAVVVIVAVGVTAAVIFSGPSKKPKVPRPAPGGVLPTTHALASHRLAVGQRDAVGTVVLASTMTPLASGGALAVNLHGVSMTPAPGWAIVDQDQDSVILTNSDNSAEFSVVVIPNAGVTDVNQAASLAISGFVKGSGLTNVQQQQEGPAQTIQSNNFQQGLVTDYTGDIQSNQGTLELYGNWITMLNPSTQTVCFVDVDAPSSDALQAAMPDAKSMVGSML
jgi:hypothetical protein